MSSDLVFPAPELVDNDEAWTIEHAPTGATNAQKRILRAPLEADPHAAVHRIHELAHVKFSPPAPPTAKELAALGVDRVTVQAAEDFRINTLAARRGLDFGAGYGEASMNAAIESVLMAADNPDDQAALAQRVLLALDQMPEDRASFRRLARRALVVPVAKLEAEIESFREAWRDHDPDFAETLDLAKRLRPMSEQLKDKLSSLAQGTKLKLPFVPPKLPDEGYFIPWGTMTLQEPARPVRVEPSPQARRRVRHAEEGIRPHRLSRLTMDRRVFGEKRRTRGIGSLLIDGSGSMSWTRDEIVGFVERSPTAIIAIYGSWDGEHGATRILAKRGRLVAQADLQSPGGSNCVDYPALRWLAEQPAPRFWMSDGQVTGVGDRFSKVNQRICFEFCKHRKITRVAKLQEIAK